jgi:hypothetical protein
MPPTKKARAPKSVKFKLIGMKFDPPAAHAPLTDAQEAYLDGVFDAVAIALGFHDKGAITKQVNPPKGI